MRFSANQSSLSVFTNKVQNWNLMLPDIRLITLDYPPLCSWWIILATSKYNSVLTSFSHGIHALEGCYNCPFTYMELTDICNALQFCLAFYVKLFKEWKF